MSVTYLIPIFSRVITWPAFYGAIFFTVWLGLLTVAMAVALLSKDDKRADRAYLIFRDLLCRFRLRRPQ